MGNFVAKAIHRIVEFNRKRERSRQEVIVELSI